MCAEFTTVQQIFTFIKKFKIKVIHIFIPAIIRSNASWVTPLKSLFSLCSGTMTTPALEFLDVNWSFQCFLLDKSLTNYNENTYINLIYFDLMNESWAVLSVCIKNRVLVCLFYIFGSFRKSHILKLRKCIVILETLFAATRLGLGLRLSWNHVYCLNNGVPQKGYFQPCKSLEALISDSILIDKI